MSTTLLEFANQAAFPATGETGKIYVALDNNDAVRWTGSAYVRISDRITAAGITDSTAIGRALVTAAGPLDGLSALTIPATATTADATTITNALAARTEVRLAGGTYVVTKNGVTVPAGKTLSTGRRVGDQGGQWGIERVRRLVDTCGGDVEFGVVVCRVH
jgi:hypothetical protein